MFRSVVSRGLRIIAVVLAVLLASTHADAQNEAMGQAGPQRDFTPVQRDIEQPYGGWSLSVDNDLFAGTRTDRDYTAGVGLTVSGAQIGAARWSPDRALRRVDRAIFGAQSHFDGASVQHSAQLGLVIFTPQDLTQQSVEPNDRPYASLLYVTNARQYVDAQERRVRHTGLTLGVLGLSLTSDVHSAIHETVGDEKPRGYRNQISAGGEPTLRYVIGDSRLHTQRLAFGTGLLETKTTAEMSVGYLTEASYAISTRVGNIGTPWWTFNPERIDYIAQPSAMTRARGGSELYFWAGMKLRVRAYNAFLQGQFRDSAHTFDASELRHVIGEAWVGVTSQLASGTSVSYTLRYQTAEIRDGIGDRDPLWGGITLSHSF